jgi:hypothetical protein
LLLFTNVQSILQILVRKRTFELAFSVCEYENNKFI